jgi:hypothetical protein
VRDGVDDVGVDADLAAAEHLAGELQQDALELMIGGRFSDMFTSCHVAASVSSRTGPARSSVGQAPISM